MSRPKAQRRGQTLVELIIVVTLLGLLGSVVGYGLCSILPAGRQEAALSKARILNAARCSYALSAPGASEAWAAAGSDEARFLLLSSAGLVDGSGAALLTSSGGYSLHLTGALRDRTVVELAGGALSYP